MQKKPGTGYALSETVTITLILLLVVIIAVVIYLLVIGHADIVPKSAYIVARGTGISTKDGTSAISLFHLEGDSVNLNRSRSGSGMAPVSFSLRTPANTTEEIRASPLISDNTWGSGETLVISQDPSGYWITDNISARIASGGTLGPLMNMSPGNYTVNIVDRKADVLVAAIPVVIYGNGTTGPQYSPGLIATYYSDEAWSIPAATNLVSRIRFADSAASASWGSDVVNWPVGYIGKAETFSARFDGFIKIDTENDYTFYLTSDDGSFLEIDGTAVVNNGGLHSPQMRQGTIHLTPGYHTISVRMFEHTGLAVIHLEQSTPSAARAFSTQLYHIPSTAPMADFTASPTAGSAPLLVSFTDKSIDATAWSWDFGDSSGGSHAKNPTHTYSAAGKYSVTLVATNKFGSSTVKKTDFIEAGTFSPGFAASYYRGQTWSDLAGSRVDPRIQFSDQGGSSWPSDMVGRQNDFSVKWSGYLYVPADDSYTFYLNSDDGSFMDLDGTTDFINNGGDHSAREYTGSATLSAGYHQITVRMYENGGVAVAQLRFTNTSVPSPQYVTNIWHI